MRRGSLLQIAFLLLAITASSTSAVVASAKLQQPRDGVAYHALGHERYRSGQYEEAIEAFRQAIRLIPNRAEVYNDLGVPYDTLACGRTRFP